MVSVSSLFWSAPKSLSSARVLANELTEVINKTHENSLYNPRNRQDFCPLLPCYLRANSVHATPGSSPWLLWLCCNS